MSVSLIWQKRRENVFYFLYKTAREKGSFSQLSSCEILLPCAIITSSVCASFVFLQSYKNTAFSDHYLSGRFVNLLLNDLHSEPEIHTLSRKNITVKTQPTEQTRPLRRHLPLFSRHQPFSRCFSFQQTGLLSVLTQSGSRVYDGKQQIMKELL